MSMPTSPQRALPSKAFNRKDAIAGLVFIAIGAGFGIHGAISLPIGTAFRMGPGMFPILLSLVLVGLGILCAVSGLGRPEERMEIAQFRAIALISLSPIVFALLVRPAGLVPALAAAVIMSSYGSRRARPLTTLATAAALIVFCCGVFVWGLGLPVRLFGFW